jgi:hypothetical protein
VITINRKGRKREEKREPNRPSLSLSPQALTPPKRTNGMQMSRKRGGAANSNEKKSLIII